jgi:hypothetical protein
MMSETIDLPTLLDRLEGGSQCKLEVFAMLNLGMVQSLWSGALTVADAITRFYNVGNCQYVRRRMRSKTADEIMSRGVQLPDLFDVLPPAEAQRELANELEAIRSLCLKALRTGVRSRVPVAR